MNEEMKMVGAEHLQGFREEIDQYTDIRNAIAELTAVLMNMNTLTPDLHVHSDFNVLIRAIEDRLSE